jgi:hypothetical protein
MALSNKKSDIGGSLRGVDNGPGFGYNLADD